MRFYFGRFIWIYVLCVTKLAFQLMMCENAVFSTYSTFCDSTCTRFPGNKNFMSTSLYLFKTRVKEGKVLSVYEMGAHGGVEV